MKKLAAIILAAGKSKRMKTKTPKILHPLMGKPMIEYVLEAVGSTGASDIIMVVGHEKEQIIQYLEERVKFAEQTEQLGTGHAVMSAMPFLEHFEGDILILCGDMPLLSGETLGEFIKMHREEDSHISLLTSIMEHPGNLGRIIRDESGSVKQIVEAVDADEEQLKIREVNTGTYLFDAVYLRKLLPGIGRKNVQNEMYLTETISLSNKEGVRVEAMACPDFRESFGVNHRGDLAEANQVLRERINHNLMIAGVTLYDPLNTYIDGTVKIGEDTTILPGCMITGNTVIGANCTIGPHTRIENSEIGDDVTVTESVVNESKLGNGTKVGPFAHVRPGSETGENVKIGNFVETKKSAIGNGSKVSHLSYVGDSTIGVKVNVGAGTITCNYDGVNKNPTVIKDGAFIGSNSSLVAPVTIGEGASTGAGSVVTKDVPPHYLAVGVPAKSVKKKK